MPLLLEWLADYGLNLNDLTYPSGDPRAAALAAIRAVDDARTGLSRDLRVARRDGHLTSVGLAARAGAFAQRPPTTFVR